MLRQFERLFSTNSLHKDINKYYKKANIKITMNNLLQYKNYSKSNMPILLNEDLKARLSNKIIEIENFPNGISMMPSIQKVNEWYIKSFGELNTVNIHDENEYAKTLEGIYNRHSSTLITVANGIIEYKKYLHSIFGDSFDILEYLDMNYREERINNYLDMFYSNRISIRLLISHYLSLQNANLNTIHYNGIVSIHEPITNVINDAAEISQIICERVFNDSPKINMSVVGEPPVFPFIRDNMFYIFLELFKNSMRATMESRNSSDEIDVLICNNDTHVSVKVSDRGDGIECDNLKNIWSYFYSTAKNQRLDNGDKLNDFDGSSPLAGYGYGLPITNLMIKYFDDSVQINSIKGIGTDVYLHFKKNYI